MASTYLTRTQGTPTNVDKGTMSFWVKRGTLDKNNEYIIQNYIDGSNYGYIRWKSDNELQVYSAGINDEKRTIKKFRDTNAWYHIVLRVDTSQSSAGDRVRLYINGEQETNFDPGTNGSQNADYDLFKATGTMRIGYVSSGTATYFDGCLSHFHYCDGQSYGPDTFGETDSVTGEWKIKTEPSMTMGNQGFTILKDNNTITDQSSNSNDFTLGAGTLTKTEDCPSNVFAVCDNLTNTNSALTFSHGNNTMTNSGQWLGALSTLPMFKGKFYWEFKCTGNFMTGVSQLNSKAVQTDNISLANNGYSSKWAYGWEMINGGNKSNNNNSSTSYGSSYSSSDIGMVAFDADNGAIWFGKNGTWQASATQTEIENGTTTNAAWTGLTNASGYVASFSTENSTMNLNFGNGYFGTTAVSSAGNNASGNGIFEYDVPAGFTALCTKGINSF